MVLLNHMIKKKIEKSHPEKRLNFRVGSKWHIFRCLIFLVFVHNSLQNQKITKVGGVLKNSGNLQQDGQKNLQNCWRNI